MTNFAISEHLEQASLIQWARTLEYKYPALKRLHAIPNGGAVGIGRGKKLKAEGVRKGVFDLFLAIPRDQIAFDHSDYYRICGLYIELKTEKGKLSEDQTEWLNESNRLGYDAFVCIGWIEAAQAIGHYLEIDSKDIPR